MIVDGNEPQHSCCAGRQQDSPVRIGYLLRMYPRFSQTFVVNEILELQRQGLDVRVASMRKPTDGVFHESISRVRCRAHYLPEGLLGELRRGWSAHAPLLRRRPGSYLRAAGQVLASSGVEWADLIQAGHLLKWVRKERIDHVHVHFGTNEASLALLAHLLGDLSYSMTLHAFDIFRDNVDRRLLARKINHSRFTITVSRFNREHLLRTLPGVDGDKIVVQYNGIDLDLFSANGEARQPGLILGIGRLIEKKGFVYLVRAVGKLRAAGLPVSCKIVGDGPLESALRKEIDRSDLSGCVELTGPLSQHTVVDLLRRSSCFVLPCVQARDGNVDALPTVLLESLAAGCPSVSTRISGVPEIIEDGVSGLLVPPGDEDALAAAVRKVLDDPSLGERLAEGGHRQVRERFDIRRNVRAVHDRFLEAVERSVRRQGSARCSMTPAVAGLSPVVQEG